MAEQQSVLEERRAVTGPFTIAAVMVLLPMLMACLNGLHRVPASVPGVSESLVAECCRTLLDAPCALPAFFAPARMAVPPAVLAKTVRECLAIGTGIGNLIALSSSTSARDILWSDLATLTALAGASHANIPRVERLVYAHSLQEQVTL